MNLMVSGPVGMCLSFQFIENFMQYIINQLHAFILDFFLFYSNFRKMIFSFKNKALIELNAIYSFKLFPSYE
jgi:hypothetical protein